jgi:hypothetical protein
MMDWGFRLTIVLSNVFLLGARKNDYMFDLIWTFLDRHEVFLQHETIVRARRSILQEAQCLQRSGFNCISNIKINE